jgi:hypothetical protein
METDNVRPLAEFLEGAVFPIEIGRGIGVIGQDFHLEPFADVIEYLSYFPGTDYSDGLAKKVEAYQAIEAEIEFTGPDIGMMGAPYNTQEQGHGMFRHCIG